MTVILYLNPGWAEDRGGNLKIFTVRKEAIGSSGSGLDSPAPPALAEPHEGSSIYDTAWPHEAPVPEPEEEVTTVVPAMDRLIVFWSDERCPHEVTAVNEGYGPRLAVTTWYFDNAELAEMNGKEGALAKTVKDWADRCLVWDEDLRVAEDDELREAALAGAPALDNAEEQAREIAFAKAEVAEQQKAGWMNAVHMHTARARKYTSNPPAVNRSYLRDGLWHRVSERYGYTRRAVGWLVE